MWQPGAQERRAALVQLCDQDTILLIQVSSMKSMCLGLHCSAHLQTVGTRIPKKSFGLSPYVPQHRFKVLIYAQEVIESADIVKTGANILSEFHG